MRKLTIATRLRQAVAEGRLELHYQPKVDLGSGRVDGAEALIRWCDEQLGVVGPDEFIPLAESTDLIRPLTNWTLAEAFRQSAAWRARIIAASTAQMAHAMNLKVIAEGVESAARA